MIVLIINGAPRTGKDTFIDLLRQVTGKFVYAYSSIDWVKDLAKDAFDWDGTKDTKSRQLLSDLKDLATAWNDIPFKNICYEILHASKEPLHPENTEFPADYFCTNIREPQEIQKLVDWCKQQGIPCYSVWIRRDEAEKAATKDLLNHADSHYMDYKYDWTLHNNGTLEGFKDMIQFCLDHGTEEAA